MKVTSLISLGWKETIRHPFFQQSSIFTILYILFWSFFLAPLIEIGSALELIFKHFFLIVPKPIDLLIVCLIPLFLLDLLLKLLFKENSYPFGSFFRISGGKSAILKYMLIREVLSLWNIYLMIFFIPLIILKIQPIHGLIFAVLVIINIWIFQVMISQIVKILNLTKTKYIAILALLFIIPYLTSQSNSETFNIVVFNKWILISSAIIAVVFTFFLTKIGLKKLKHMGTVNSTGSDNTFNFLSKVPSNSSLSNFFLLGLKMTWRSPRLRYQFIVYIIITAIYIIILNSKSEFLETFITRVSMTSLIVVLYPLVFNQYIYSAEASFFDRLILTPRFELYLKSRYIQTVLFSMVSFLTFITISDNQHFNQLELISILLFNIGTITLLSFVSTLVANSKYDLFGSFAHSWTNPPSGQIIVVTLAYLGPIALVVLVHHFFQQTAATYFMLGCGIIGLILSNRWLSFIISCFRSKRYDKMELFRAQN